MKKTLVSLATLALLGVGGVASAAPVALDFTSTTASIPGLTQTLNTILGVQTFVADEFVGGYTEKVQIGAGGAVGSAAFASFSAAQNNAVGVNSFMGTGYKIYATFTSTATNVGINFNGVTGAFQLWMDPNNNTTSVLGNGTYTGLGAILAGPTVATVNNSDDYLLATSTSMRVTGSFASYGQLNPPPSFDFTFDNFSVTTLDQSAAAGNQSGASFFIAPNPFLITVSTVGTLLGLQPTFGNHDVTGSLNLTFSSDQTVPEPASLALVGLGLLGLAASRRRKSV